MIPQTLFSLEITEMNVSVYRFIGVSAWNASLRLDRGLTFQVDDLPTMPAATKRSPPVNADILLRQGYGGQVAENERQTPNAKRRTRNA
jgi:hypothetical protein